MTIHWDMRSVLEATSQRAVIFTVATSCLSTPPGILSALILCRSSKGSFCWELKQTMGISTPDICFLKLSSPWNVSYIFFCLFFIELIRALIFKCRINSESPRFNEIYSKLWNSFLSQWRNTLDCIFVTEETE